MKNIKLEIKNRFGNVLSSQLYTSEEVEVDKIALFVHCFACSNSFSVVENISRELINSGISVLSFDFTGLGLGEGDFCDTNISTNTSDILDINDYLSKHYSSASILIGHSLGGVAALLSANLMPNLEAIVTIATPSYSSHITKHFYNSEEYILNDGEVTVLIGERPFMIEKQFLEDLERHNVEEEIGKLRKPLLIMHSPQDLIVGIENAASLYQKATHSKSFITLDGADHLITNKRDAFYIAKIISIWVKRYLDIENNQCETINTSGDGKQKVSEFTSQFNNKFGDNDPVNFWGCII